MSIGFGSYINSIFSEGAIYHYEHLSFSDSKHSLPFILGSQKRECFLLNGVYPLTVVSKRSPCHPREESLGPTPDSCLPGFIKAK